MTMTDDRDECYDRIRQCMSKQIGDYYRKYPERQLDARSIAAVAFAYAGIERVLTVLEDYDIARRVPA